MPNKLTDTDVKKALECAIRNDCDCNCVFLLPNKVQDVLDLINRLQAENEVLESRIGVYETCNARKDEAIRGLETENERLKKANASLSKEIIDTKIETYKQCIEEVKKELSLIRLGCQNLLDNEGVFAIDLARKKVDNLLKELVGEDNV